MNRLVILSVSENKIVKEFTVPISALDTCLYAVDMAYCGAMVSLDEQCRRKIGIKLDTYRSPVKIPRGH